MEIQCDSKYLIFPIGHYAQKKRLEFYHRDKLVYDLEIELDYAAPDYEVYIDVGRFSGMELRLACVPEVNLQIKKSDKGYAKGELYKEKYRPDFHFSPKRGWLNDPNGLVWYEGCYHLFFQHNPAGCKWGNMHWGHAISRDLIHWEEKGITLFPDKLGTMFSGCAVVDEENKSGLQNGAHKVLLLYYTAAGDSSLLSKGRNYTQCLAYSADGGKTFVKYHKNPVIGHIIGGNRDPKVVFHIQSGQYIMSLYLEENLYALLASENLLDWTLIQKITLGDDSECPDFYPLPVDGDENNIKWVLSGAADRYRIGSFDGQRFENETEVKRLHYGKNSYASQSFYCLADGDNRRVRIAWNTFDLPAMPFNKCMTVPCEMKLKTIGGEVFLCTLPVAELKELCSGVRRFYKLPVEAGQCHRTELEERLADIELELSWAGETVFSIFLFGIRISCDIPRRQITCMGDSAPIIGEEGRIKLRILLDKIGIELYVNQGEVYFSTGIIMDYNLNYLEIQAESKDITIEKMIIGKLNSIWQ